MFDHWKISRRDAVMVVVFLLACAALWFLDILHTAPPPEGVKCKARILSGEPCALCGNGRWRLRPHRSTIGRLPSGAVAARSSHSREGCSACGGVLRHGWHEARQRRRAALRSRPGRLALMARRVIHPPLRGAELGRSSRRSPPPSRRRLPCRAGLAPSRSPPFRPSPCALKAFLYGASPDACAYPCAIHVIG